MNADKDADKTLIHADEITAMPKLTDDEKKEIIKIKIALLEAAYLEFDLKIKELENEQDAYINKHIKKVDKNKIQGVLKKIKDI